MLWPGDSLLAEVSQDEAKMRERRETLSLSFLAFLPRPERPLLARKAWQLISIKFWIP